MRVETMRRGAIAIAFAACGGNAAAQGGEAIRLVRSTAGTKGTLEGSRYIIEDPRNTFILGQDRQVVVLFEWEARPGRHQCKASWKNPSGNVVLVAPFEYNAPGRRFSVYWSLAIPDTAAAGLWGVETEVDGAPAGTHTFQVQPADVAAPVPGRRVLSSAELYTRALAKTVPIEGLGPDGRKLWTASGFFGGQDLLLTTFQAVESASRLRVLLSDGRRMETDSLAAWNRRQDWAALRLPGLGLDAALDRSLKMNVGDRCVFVDTAPEAGSTLGEAAIVGVNSSPAAGNPLLLSAAGGPNVIGAPLLNEYGDIVAILGTTLTPGMTSLDTSSLSFYTLHRMSRSDRPMALPISVLPEIPVDGGTSIGQLKLRGETVPPLERPIEVITGVVARGVEAGPVPRPVGETDEFATRNPEGYVFLTVNPREKRQGVGAFRLYDLDNKLVRQGAEGKLSLRPKVYSVLSWRLPLEGIKPGVYRVDLAIDGAPAWRTFFRVVD